MSGPKEKKNASVRHRVQFDFTPASYKKLLEIRDRAGATSNAEVVRDALRVYNWVLDQQDKGMSIQVVSDDGCTVVRVELLI